MSHPINYAPKRIVEPEKGPLLNRIVVGAVGLATLAASCGILLFTEVGFNQDRADAVIPFATGLLGLYALVSAIQGRWYRPQ